MDSLAATFNEIVRPQDKLLLLPALAARIAALADG